MSAAQSVEISLLILAKDEEKNLLELLPELRRALGSTGLTYEVVIITAGSDNTADVAARFGAISHQQREPGYGSAFVQGITSCQGRYLITLDGDLSHPPDLILSMISRRDQADLLVASRYVEGAGARMPVHRALLSRLLSAVFRAALRIPIRDLSSGYRLYRAAILQEMTLEGKNFDVLLEALVRAHISGYKIEEIPFSYSPRRHGRSHARLIMFALGYLMTLFRLMRLRYGGLR